MTERDCISDSYLKLIISFILSNDQVQLLSWRLRRLSFDVKWKTFLFILRKVTKNNLEVSNVRFSIIIDQLRTVVQRQTDEVKIIQIPMDVLRPIKKFERLTIQLSSFRRGTCID